MEFFLNFLEDSAALVTIFSYGLLSISLNAEQHYTYQNKIVDHELQFVEDKETELFKKLNHSAYAFMEKIHIKT